LTLFFLQSCHFVLWCLAKTFTCKNS